MQAILDAEAEDKLAGAHVAAVISNNREAYALKRAEKAGVPGLCVSPKDYPDRETYHRAFLEAMDSLQPDLIVLAGFLVKIPAEMIRRYSGRILNIHPSLIPAFCGTGYYGLKVHEGVLKRGVRVTGATVHFVDEGMDTGPILLQKAVEVRPDDTPETLQKRVMEEAEWLLLPSAIRLIAEGRVKIWAGKAVVQTKEGDLL